MVTHFYKLITSIGLGVGGLEGWGIGEVERLGGWGIGRLGGRGVEGLGTGGVEGWAAGGGGLGGCAPRLHIRIHENPCHMHRLNLRKLAYDTKHHPLQARLAACCFFWRPLA